MRPRGSDEFPLTTPWSLVLGPILLFQYVMKERRSQAGQAGVSSSKGQMDRGVESRVGLDKLVKLERKDIPSNPSPSNVLLNVIGQ
jgi:hypothetical protein